MMSLYYIIILLHPNYKNKKIICSNLWSSNITISAYLHLKKKTLIG